MNFGPTTQRFLVALAVVALLFTIWQVAASPVDPADIQRALEKQDARTGQTAPTPTEATSTELATLEGSGEQPAPEDYSAQPPPEDASAHPAPED